MKFVFRDGELAQGDWDVVVNDNLPGWVHTGMRVGDLSKAKSFEIMADKIERLICPMEGEGITVEYRIEGESDFTSQK